MDIDNSRRVLVLAATSNADPTWAEFYRVDGILQLQEIKAELSGHPGPDMMAHLPERVDDGVWCSGHHLPRSTVAKIKRWQSQGLFIAVSIAQGGKRKRNRQSLVVSWAKPNDYLNEAQRFWLDAYCQSSFTYTQKRDGRNAWGLIFNAIAEIAGAIGEKPKLKRKAKPSKTKTTRKAQRRQELEKRRYGNYAS